MFGKKVNISKKKPLILIAPLDWGLGHITRSVPLIRELAENGCNVIVACNSMQKAILKAEFPNLEFADLEGYGVQYGNSATSTKLKMLLQLPKILTQIKKENLWLKDFLAQNPVNAVISDNRYGFFSRKIPSFFITHQLKVKSGSGSKADNYLQRFLYRYINKFQECWVPDFEQGGVAGELSHPARLPLVPVKYLGCLSRFENRQHIYKDITPIYKFLVILSGPEPQRTILEKIMIGQLQQSGKKAVIVRGLPGIHLDEEKNNLRAGETEIINYANTEQLNQLIYQSELIICRSGYTTIMDMLKMGKKIIAIPTPGQSEQEYLAEMLEKNGLGISFRQSEFSISEAQKRADELKMHSLPDRDMDAYKIVLRNFVNSLII